MSTKLDFQLKLQVYEKQLELSFFINITKTQSVSFPSYIARFHIDRYVQKGAMFFGEN